MPRKKTTVEYIAELQEKSINVLPLEEYRGRKVKIKHLYKGCGHVARVIPNSLLQRGGCKTGKCGECSRKDPKAFSIMQSMKAKENLQKDIDAVHGKGVIKVVDIQEYRNASTPINLKCINGHKWKVTPNSVKSGGGCPTCYINKKSLKAVEKAYSEACKRGIFISPNNPLPKRMIDKAQWGCRECKGLWETTLGSICHAGSGCPHCTTNSKGEKYVKELLEDLGIEFSTQVKFEGLMRKRGLSYDFQVKEYLIECQGIQHYEPVEHFGGEGKFKIQQERDQLKREFAEANGYTLIEIPYTHYKKPLIKEILKSYGILKKAN